MSIIEEIEEKINIERIYLERDIQSFLERKLTKFHKRTNLLPDSIDIHLTRLFNIEEDTTAILNVKVNMKMLSEILDNLK